MAKRVLRKMFMLLSPVIFNLHSYAQDNNWMGFKVGMNVAYLGGEEIVYNPRLAYHVGFLVNRAVARHVNTQLGLLYSLQGAQNESVVQIKENYSYLSIPAIVELAFYDRFSLDLGGQLSYLFRARSVTGIIDNDVKDKLNPLDLALCIGASYRHSSHWKSSVRYNYSLNPTSKNASSLTGRFPNRVFQFSVAYLLQVKTKEKENKK